MRTRSVGVALGALLTLVTLPGVALAGPPGKWTRVTPTGAGVSKVMRPGLARTADGVLHVSWARREPGSADSVLHSSISADARTISAPDFIFTGPEGANASTALVQSGGALRVFFAATNQLDSALMTATSADGGRIWLVGPDAASRGGPAAKPVAAANGISAALGPAGSVFSAWGASAPDGAGFHVGLDPAVADGAFSGGAVIDPGIAVDSKTGAAFVAAGLLDEGRTAVFPIAPPGPRAVVPRSGANQLQHPTHISGRIGAPGVYVAYTRGSSEFLGKAALWDVAARRGRVLGDRGDEDVSLAAVTGGRLWVFWRNDNELRARRSNAAVTRFGRVVAVENPRDTDAVFDLTGNGSAGPLDVLVQADAGGGVASWHQRILPGLTVKATAGAGKVLFRVTDAGDPVRRATVRVTGDGRATTGSDGAATFVLEPGRYRASASKSGFAGGSVRVRVR